MNNLFLFKLLLAGACLQLALSAVIIPLSSKMPKGHLNMEQPMDDEDTGSQIEQTQHEEELAHGINESQAEIITTTQILKVNSLNTQLDDLYNNMMNLISSIERLEHQFDQRMVTKKSQIPLAYNDRVLSAASGIDHFRIDATMMQEMPGFAVDPTKSELIFPSELTNQDIAPLIQKLDEPETEEKVETGESDEFYKRMVNQVVLTQLIKKLQRNAMAVNFLNDKLEDTLGSIESSQSELVKRLNTFLSASEKVFETLTQ